MALSDIFGQGLANSQNPYGEVWTTDNTMDSATWRKLTQQQAQVTGTQQIPPREGTWSYIEYLLKGGFRDQPSSKAFFIQEVGKMLCKEKGEHEIVGEKCVVCQEAASKLVAQRIKYEGD